MVTCRDDRCGRVLDWLRRCKKQFLPSRLLARRRFHQPVNTVEVLESILVPSANPLTAVAAVTPAQQPALAIQLSQTEIAEGARSLLTVRLSAVATQQESYHFSRAPFFRQWDKEYAGTVYVLQGSTDRVEFEDENAYGNRGATYAYFAQANNRAGTSAYSNTDFGHALVETDDEVPVDPDDTDPPTSPTLPKPFLVSVSNGTYRDKIRVVFGAVRGATSYELYRVRSDQSVPMLIRRCQELSSTTRASSSVSGFGTS